MKFKEFMQFSEEQSSTDKGLMGYPVSSSVRKPSDGQPFKDILSSVAGQEPRANTGAQSGGAMKMMRKKMKKS